MIVPKVRQPVPPAVVQCEKVLLVEGDTPAHFFEAISKHLGIADDIEIRNYGGIRELGKYLRTLASTADFRSKVRSLGITRDADNDVHAAMQSVQYAVANAGLSAGVTVRIEILPNDGPGIIETLCIRSVETHASRDCIIAFLDSLRKRQVGLDDGVTIAKHIAQAHLIAMNLPQLMPGVATYKGVWPLDAKVFDSVKTFLMGL